MNEDKIIIIIDVNGNVQLFSSSDHPELESVLGDIISRLVCNNPSGFSEGDIYYERRKNNNNNK